MKFFTPLLPKNVFPKVVGFYLKFLGRNVKPVVLDDFVARYENRYNCTNT